MEPVFVHGWKSADGVFADFEGSRWGGEPESYIDRDDYEILFGSYSYENYSGDAFVLARRRSDGKLYEVNGGHCSCYGLEGQWRPEECTVADIRFRLTKGRLGREDYCGNEFADELTAFLDALEVSI